MYEETDIPQENENSSVGETGKKKKKNGCLSCFGLLVFALILLVIGGAAGFAICTASGVASRYLVKESKSAQNNQIDNEAIMDKLESIESLVDNSFLYDVDAEDVEDEIYKGFMKGLKDDYAEYYNPQEYKQLTEEDAGEYEGIGVTVYKDPSNGYTHISEVFKDDPAYNAGLQNGDLITSVNGESTAELTVTEVVRKIKDPALKTVTLGILRDTETFEVDVTKTKISLETVEWEMKEDHIGYLSLSQFIENSSDDFLAAIDAMEKEGMEKLIIDLRDNGGGLVNTCSRILSRFVKEGDVLVYAVDKKGEKSSIASESDQTLDIPIVLLVNGNSASASEIMTGCMQDYGLATVIGQTSYGKGIIQNIIPLSDGSAVKFTILEYETPNGRRIHKKGIEPDIKVEISDEDWVEVRNGKKKDTQLEKAIEYLKEQ